MSTSDRIRRLARLIKVLSRADDASALTIRKVAQATASSRATTYRDLQTLRDSGYDIRAFKVNGEARYRIASVATPDKTLTARQRSALRLARRALTSVEGSPLLGELDALLKRACEDEHEEGIELLAPPLAYQPDRLRVVHRGVLERRKLLLHYRGVGDDRPVERVVWPHRLLVVDQQPYLVAYDERRRAERTFKVARIARVELLVGSFLRDGIDARARERSARAVKVWSGEAIDVVVRIHAEAARFLPEWPLTPQQVLLPLKDGGIDVHARVFGLEETLRWLLRWGRHAEAIAPPALRRRASEELFAAAQRYTASRSSQDPETTSARRR